MKNTLIVIIIIAIGWLVFLSYQLFTSIKQPRTKAKFCSVETGKITDIQRDVTNNIVLENRNGDLYYISRGLERGLNLDSLRVKVLNKTVTLHLPKVLGGLATSGHIVQITVGNEIIL